MFARSINDTPRVVRVMIVGDATILSIIIELSFTIVICLWYRPQTVASLIDETRVIIYNRNMFKIQATDFTCKHNIALKILVRPKHSSLLSHGPLGLWKSFTASATDCTKSFFARRLSRSLNTWPHDTWHNDIQHNDTQHNDIQHNDIQHNDTQHNNK
jgi:hypothetical protein